MNLYRPGSVPQRIMERAEALPEAMPLCPKAFLDLGTRAAVDQAFSRLVREKRLLRIGQGLYVRPVNSPYGPLPPLVEDVIPQLARLWGETIVPSGAGAANYLGLITQFPLRPAYWTSGTNRDLHFGRLRVRLRHRPRWQLLFPGRLPGLVVRALAFLHPSEAEEALTRLAPQLSGTEAAELLAARPLLPGWMAVTVGTVLSDG